MTSNSRRKQILAGTFLLTAAAFIAKFLSAVYRVPFQNMVGNVGFYVYQQIYPIYGIGMTVALNGLPLFISKLVVDIKDPRDQMAVIYRIQLLVTILSVTFFLGLQFGATWIAAAMSDVRLAPVIKAVSWMFLLGPFLATWRGYFQGRMNMRPTAYSQVIEQVVRVTFILVSAAWAVHHFANPYQIGTLAMFSAPIAGVCALLVLYVSLCRTRLPKSSHRQVYTRLLSRILFEGGTLCLVSAVMLLLQLVDSFSVVSGLRDFGLSFSTAQNIKGIYDRSQTLVQLGMVVTIASTTAVLPNLSLAHARSHETTFDHLARTTMRVNLALSLAMSAGLFVLMPQINQLLFSTAGLNLTIAVYCFSIVLTTVILTDNMVLQARGQYGPTMAAILCGFGVKIIVNKWLVASLGIIGASVATLMSLAVMVLLMRTAASRSLAGLTDGRQLIKLVVVLVVMMTGVGLAATIIGDWLIVENGRLQALLIVMIGVPLGAGIFLYGCKRLRVFTLREWFAVPLISKLLRVMK
ncbi:putative polysaccharide biosynthesis protein [Lentilactobacillus farraginis]|uniref:PST family polysaccharide transporter n=2 Tax=Lentilactobacillus farraginis DSM 18382 = JCM 14108 TaxID=1423743 RepID=A0A0R1VV46_9LACO|nr:oligosaccharide flippase family protein [Lentilactobacillus farraginis]KRM09624.1 PST family polysaccharide transporter [Lentilactobacillus farraginis DSM 18382 = JCM 14108]